MISACTNENMYKKLMTEINTLGEQLAKDGFLAKEDESDIVARATEAQNSLSFLSTEDDLADVNEAMDS